MTQRHMAGRPGFTLCGESADHRTQYGATCVYCDAASKAPVPCYCGSMDAYWWGDTMRVYSCDDCRKRICP